MIFRQLFDHDSSTFTYLLACEVTREALIIDPVLGRVDRYLQLLEELDLKLAKAVDTHCHADHITALGALRDKTRCITVMSEYTDVDVVSMRVRDGDKIDVGNISLTVLHTPGHTGDSCCFVMDDRVFTGDTLLIRGTGRTDFQQGDAHAAFVSLFNKLMTLPEETFVYPGHDYKGESVSTIAEERAFNPRLQVTSADQYAEIMNSLNLPNPKMMDVAIPANLTIGYQPSDPQIDSQTLGIDEAESLLDTPNILFIDLRETSERQKDGIIKGSLHTPYASLEENIRPGGLLRSLSNDSSSTLLLYCSFGERSALALQALREAGIGNVKHIGGGIEAWKKAGSPLEKISG